MARNRDTAFFGHPEGLSTLFFTEMWERLSYYGGRTFLAIYMVTSLERGGRGMTDGATGIVMALYLSSVYLLSLPGGWIADRFIGQRAAVAGGGVAIMIGNALLALPTDAGFYPGLALIAIGTGFLKPNVSSLVGQLYKPDDIRRDGGYSIYYMGINIGAVIAPLAGTLIAQSDNFRAMLTRNGLDPNLCWKFGFAVPAIGMAIGIVQFLIGGKRLGDTGARPTIPADPQKAARDRTLLGVVLGGIAGVVALGFVLDATGAVMMTKNLIGNVFGVGLALIAIGLFYGLLKNARDRNERRGVIAMIPLFIGCIAFFGVAEQAGTTLSLFAERYVQRNWLGIDIPASAYQFCNSAFIIILAPLFAIIWVRLARRNKEPSSVNKFAIGMVFTALSFVVMLPALSAVTRGPEAGGTASPVFLIALYFLTTCGELCISPVGLSSMSKLAPSRLAGMVMGTWFLATAIGNYIAGRAAGFSEARGFAFLFYTLIISALVVSLGLFLIAPAIRRMMNNAPKDVPTKLAAARVVKSGDPS
jgi:proton-dependent oligopeptide transporter, POT family